MYDAQTAARDGVASTGHGLPAPNPYGPFPLNQVMAAGSASREELIGGLDRGLLVTRFHYTNPVHPKLAIVTGMTRDGTFLVEGGRILGPVKNLRFTQSYLDALAGTVAVASERKTLKGFLGGVVVPALRIESWIVHGHDGALMAGIDADIWVCGECRSVNNLRSKQCYACRTPRDVAAVDPSQIEGTGHGKLREIALPEYRPSRRAALLASALLIFLPVMQIVSTVADAILFGRILKDPALLNDPAFGQSVESLVAGSIALATLGVAVLALTGGRSG